MGDIGAVQALGSAMRAEPKPLPVVGELQRDAEVRVFEQRDHGLQVVFLLGAHPELVALDLRLDALRPVVTDLLADRLCLLRLDTLDNLAIEPVRLPGRAWLSSVERLQRDVAPDQLLLEDVQRRPDPILGLGLQNDRLITGPGDLRTGSSEVKPGRKLLLGLPKSVVDLLPVNLADDVERRVACQDLSPVLGGGSLPDVSDGTRLHRPWGIPLFLLSPPRSAATDVRRVARAANGSGL